jgi:hypothetical protein
MMSSIIYFIFVITGIIKLNTILKYFVYSNVVFCYYFFTPFGKMVEIDIFS